MAKRKRLAPANPEIAPSGLETKSYPMGWAGVRRAAPIADVAGEQAAQAAFTEVAEALKSAREEGRLIQRIPLEEIRRDHLLRDRMVIDADEMAVLEASLAARGQQTPIEVVALEGEGYGLISGLRRVEALRNLGEESVLALVRRPESADAAYVAMVEENEVRANLSFYERARVAAEAARIGVYPSSQAAVAALFAHASAPKRSKILSFVTLHDVLGAHLRFPVAIPEKLGLALVKAIETVPAFGVRLRDSLRKSPAADAAAERAALERALRRAETGGAEKGPVARGEEVAAGLFLEAGKGKVVLRGAGLDDRLLADLRAWLAVRQA